MRKLDSILMTLTFGAVLPIILFLAGWWISIDLVPEHNIFLAALASLTAGIVIDLIFLRRFLNNIYGLNILLPILVFLFYSFCTLGFFMGVPVFNLLPGVAAGIYWGRRLKHSGKPVLALGREARSAAALATLIMAVMCFSSAWIATRDLADTARNIEGMLALTRGAITNDTVWAIISLGGAGLLAMQYICTRTAVFISYRSGYSTETPAA